MIDAEQRLHNIRTKVRLISDRIWRIDGYGVCTGDLERAFIVREMNMLSGLPAKPIPEYERAMGRHEPGSPPLWAARLFTPSDFTGSPIQLAACRRP